MTAPPNPRPGNLPIEINTLVGRQREFTELHALILTTRVTTVIGTGGVGKSRLALAVARAAGPAFPDGVWHASLAELTRPELLCSSIATMLGQGQATDSVSELAASLADRRILLLLDNCEILVDEVARLADGLVQQSPNLAILATSREPLRIDGEVLFRLEPFAVGNASPTETSDAVELFYARADAVQPGFSARPGIEQSVVALCRRLDGLPLAIELAAAATRLFPMADLGEGGLGLEGGSRLAPERQQTLRSTMVHSYRLCTSPARLLWARMSVFRGAVDLRAIEQVCADHALPDDRIWQSLGELVDKSILTFDGGSYRMLQTIREFGEECLDEQGGRPELLSRFCRHFARLAADFDAGWFGPDQPALFGRVRTDMPNIRAALEYAAEGRTSADEGLALVTDLYMFWNCCGLLTEGRFWLDRFLDLSATESSLRVRALSVDAFLSAMLGHEPRAGELLEEAMRLAALLGDERGSAFAMRMRGMAELASSPSAAVSDLLLSEQLQKQIGEVLPYEAEALVSLGVAHCYLRQQAEAMTVLQRARDLCASEGDEFYLSWSLVMLGLAALIDGRAADAEHLLRAGLRTKLRLFNTPGIHYALEFLAWAAATEGDATRAARLMGASEALFAPVGQHLLGFPRLLEWHETYREQARHRLGAAFEVEWERGRRLSPQAAAEYALSPSGEAPLDETTTLPLTRRELEIARLVAQGMTNREIAVELVIAHRTVDSHVEHILGKLGFSSRKKIASVLLPEGSDPLPSGYDG